MSQHGKTIELSADATEWLIARAHRLHAGSYGAALEAVVREAMAREAAPVLPGKIAEPVDLWAGLEAEVRRRPTR
jgi:hypothetical protein